MNRPHLFVASFTTDVPESAANTETTALTLPNVLTEFAGQTVILVAFLAITCGTTASAMNVRIRQTSLTGTLVGESTPQAGNVVASKLTTLAAFGVDTPGDVAAFSYVVTFQGTGEGAAGTANSGFVLAIIA